MVGVVAAGDAACEILPKVDRDAPGDAVALRRQLIRMLDIAHDVPIADDAATALDTQNDTLLEILIRRFTTLLESALGQGVPRAYVPHAEDLPNLRGRLDVLRQFTTLAASPQRLASRYDEFSADIPLNQLMRAAVLILRHRARQGSTQRRLAELAFVYADISPVSPSRLVAHKFVSDRHNARWMALIRLAKLIVGGRFQSTAQGPDDGFALLFDMNVLFERYVTNLLRPIADERRWDMRAQSGGRECLYPEDLAKPVFDTLPDIQLLTGDAVDVIIDTKWKRLRDRGANAKMDVDQADIYQMIAYASLYRCERLVLIYPHHDGLRSPLPVHFRIGAFDQPVRLTIASVALESHASARASLSALLSTHLRPTGDGREEIERSLVA
ncbi:MAG: restriction endonuclease [Bauldia sp.]|nr:restriction endonuclease [Bauldia sp.]